MPESLEGVKTGVPYLPHRLLACQTLTAKATTATTASTAAMA
jgi:hypothetical protein